MCCLITLRNNCEMCAATYKLLAQLGPPDKVILDSIAVKCNKIILYSKTEIKYTIFKINENVFVDSPIHGRLLSDLENPYSYYI